MWRRVRHELGIALHRADIVQMRNSIEQPDVPSATLDVHDRVGQVILRDGRFAEEGMKIAKFFSIDCLRMIGESLYRVRRSHSRACEDLKRSSPLRTVDRPVSRSRGWHREAWPKLGWAAIDRPGTPSRSICKANGTHDGMGSGHRRVVLHIAA